MRIEYTRKLHAAGILPIPAPTQDTEALGARLDAVTVHTPNNSFGVG